MCTQRIRLRLVPFRPLGALGSGGRRMHMFRGATCKLGAARFTIDPTSHIDLAWSPKTPFASGRPAPARSWVVEHVCSPGYQQHCSGVSKTFEVFPKCENPLNKHQHTLWTHKQAQQEQVKRASRTRALEARAWNIPELLLLPLSFVLELTSGGGGRPYPTSPTKLARDPRDELRCQTRNQNNHICFQIRAVSGLFFRGRFDPTAPQTR